MPHGSDLDCVLVFKVEENPVVATAKPEAGHWRFEFLYLSDATAQIAIHAVENLHRGFSVDGAQISSSLRRPANRDPIWRGRFGHSSLPMLFTRAEFAPDVFVGNGLSASE